MKIDLKKDQAKIRSYILQRIAEYPVYINDGPGEDDASIELVTLDYSLEHGYFAVVFDTRPDADSDGEWTLHLNEETTMVSFPRWAAMIDAFCDDKPVELALPTGKKLHSPKDLDSQEAIAAKLGELLRDTMIELRNTGALAPLPITKNARLCVEEFDGHWSWPGYGNDFQLLTDSVIAKKNAETQSKEALLNTVRQLSIEKQIQFWIDQLKKRARGKCSKLDELYQRPDADGFVYEGYGPDFALDELEKIGERAVVPMLKMVRTLARYPEWEGDRPAKKIITLPVTYVAEPAIWKVQELGHAPPEAEKLLHQIFKAACKTNENRKLWGTLPYHAAVCLMELFAGYPSPGRRGNNQPIEMDAFTRYPKKT